MSRLSYQCTTVCATTMFGVCTMPIGIYGYLGGVGRYTARFIVVGCMGDFAFLLNPILGIIFSIGVATMEPMTIICALPFSVKPP